jgi:CheY-like chemotaxis protein
MNRPRVLLVDDDASIRRFVALALEELEVDLVEVPGVAPAREALAAGRFDLIITDLMMPGETGLDLLQHLTDHPAQRGAARVAVFSAGLTAAMQSQLDTFDVWRQLSKPISLTALEDCVREAVSARSSAPAETMAASTSGDESLSADERLAIDRHFGGEQALFIAFRASCRAQFSADLKAGDAAMAGGDAAALRRLAHSLKSVLATLGHPGPGATARALEDAAATADWASATPLWRQLRADIKTGQ